jgi:site-specific DNA recombinase
MGYRAGIYLRLSEEKDTAEGTDAAYQRWEDRCRALCERRDWEVAKVYREPVMSGYKAVNRKTFKAALADLREGEIQALVAIKWARLSRNRRDTATLFDMVSDSGIIVATADGQDTTTRAGRLALEIQAMLAREESEETSERVRLENEQAAKAGKPAKTPRAFGYEPGGMVVRESEATVVREAVRRLLAGEPVGSIVRDLRDRGVTGTRGKLFVATSLRNVVTAPRIAAIRMLGKQEVAGTWPEIITIEDWRKVRSLFDQRSDKARKAQGEAVYRPGHGRGDGRRYSRDYPYSGLLLCSSCGARLAGSSGSYRCQQCRKSYIDASSFERVADETVILWLSGDTFRSRLNLRLAVVQGDPADRAMLSSMRAELADLLATPERFRDRIDPGGARERELDKAISATETRMAAVPELALLADLPESEGELRAAFEHWTVSQKRAVLRAVVASITIRPATRRRHFDASRIEPPVWK